MAAADEKQAAEKPLSQPHRIEEDRATGKAQPESEAKIAAQTKPVPETAPRPAPAATPASAPPVAAKPAAGHEKPAAAAPTGPIGEPWSGDIVEALHRTFPEIAIQGFTNLKQNYLILPRESVVPVAMFLKTEMHFTLLSDLTAADYPKREKRFETVYQIYSFSRNEYLRLKVPLGENETVESVIPVWSGADWMEREVFDMFGIRFDHHPNLTRILLPEEWEGYPLRKDYSILQQDERWVRENLHIDSGQ
jgi:NADH-quinone oxidoreductase subunit C